MQGDLFLRPDFQLCDACFCGTGKKRLDALFLDSAVWKWNDDYDQERMINFIEKCKIVINIIHLEKLLSPREAFSAASGITHRIF